MSISAVSHFRVDSFYEFCLFRSPSGEVREFISGTIFLNVFEFVIVSFPYGKASKFLLYTMIKDDV